MKIALNFWQYLTGAKQNILPLVLCIGLLVTAAMAETPAHSVNEGENASTPKVTFEPSATFQKMRIDYNVTEGGKTGMRIFTDFKVYNMKGIEGYLALYFQYRNGTPLRDKNGKFASTDGTVAVYEEIRPGYDSTVYEDFDIFMPYDELDLGPGRYELRIDAKVIYKRGGAVSNLTIYNFDYTNGRNPTATFGRMWVDYNITRGGRKGMLVHLRVNVFDMKGQTGHLAFYFQHKDGSYLTTTNRNYQSIDRERPRQVALYFAISPGFDNTLYEDASVFMPYDELNLPRGNFDLQMDVDLVQKDGTFIQHLHIYDFYFERP